MRRNSFLQRLLWQTRGIIFLCLACCCAIRSVIEVFRCCPFSEGGLTIQPGGGPRLREDPRASIRLGGSKDVGVLWRWGGALRQFAAGTAAAVEDRAGGRCGWLFGAKDVKRCDALPTAPALVCEKCLPGLKAKLKRQFAARAAAAARAGLGAGGADDPAPAEEPAGHCG